MMNKIYNLVGKAYEIFKTEGTHSLISNTTNKIRTVASIKISELYAVPAVIRGEYTMSIGDIDVIFSAPNTTTVRRNRSRYESEKEYLLDFIKEVGEGDVVYDVGANTGIYSLFAGKKCNNCQVISFEPYPPNINLLNRDIVRNNLNNITAVDIALSNKDGKTQFRVPEKADIGYGSSSISVNDSQSELTVSTMRGDQLVESGEIPKPDVVKIDVEGAESLVLSGLREVLSNSDCRLLYCEVHLADVDHRPNIEDYGSELSDIITNIESFGFSVERLSDNSTEVFFKCYK